MQALRGNSRVRLIAIAIIGLLIVCLIAFLVYNIASNTATSSGGVASQPTTTEETDAPASTEDPESSEATPTEEESTPVPTPVVSETADPASDETDQNNQDEANNTEDADFANPPTATPAPQPTATPSTTNNTATNLTAPTGEEVVTYETEQLLQNPDFEAGFSGAGIAQNWEGFQNDSVLAIFSPEHEPYVDSGEMGQRITLVQATQQNRYAGIYQTVEVVPSRTYTLTMHGQIRSQVGNVQQSSYGYRMQYALVEGDAPSWRVVPDEEWVELPWDEQPMQGETNMLSYTTNIEPMTDTVTLFVRGWNKWPDKSEAQYSFDNFSMVGASPTTMERTPVYASVPASGTGESQASAFTAESDNDEEVEQRLPITGAINTTALLDDERAWAGLFILLGLSLGTILHLRRRNNQ